MTLATQSTPMFDLDATPETPPLRENLITPRPYQVEAIEAVRRELGRQRSTLIVHPTGLGKTVTMSSIARKVAEKANGRTLVIAHRRELIEQTASMLDKTGLTVGIEMADSYARSMCEPHVVVATVQTLQKKRMESWPTNYFKLVMVDEAHHATAGTYRNVLDYFAHAKVLGVTATPDRADEERIMNVFHSVAHEMTLWEAMTAPHPGPYLTRLSIVQCNVDIDLAGIRTTGGDYNQADLEERIRPLIDTLANAIRQEVGERPTLVFTPDVGSATAMATALQSLGMKADWVSGDDKDRDGKIGRYKSGETQVLCNCALLTEGFDHPPTAAIVLCRPTKSRSLYAQMVGRGTRLAPGKADCLVVDFNFLTAKHDLVRPADLFERLTGFDEMADIAKELIKQGVQQDLLEIVAKAKETAKTRQVLRVQANERSIKYRRVQYDPLSIADALGLGYVARAMEGPITRPATDKQLNYLSTFGVNAGAISQGLAGRMIDDLAKRRHYGLATPKQVSWLIAKGVDPVDARAMTKAQATTALDQLFRGNAG